MKSSVRNLILVALMSSALLIASFSSANGICHENFKTQEKIIVKYNSEGNPERNSEFWDKFRESVMPDDKSPSGNHGETEPPPRDNQNNH